MPFPTQNPRQFNRNAILALSPNQIGCYGIYRAGVRWLYVGKGDIRQRLLDHLNGDIEGLLGYFPTHFVGLVTNDMDTREKQLILEFMPLCNQRVG